MSGLQDLGSWKVWTFLGLSMALVVAMFMFQVETALPGAPDVCEEPCGDEAMMNETELSHGPKPVPVLEPFEVAPTDSKMVPDSSLTEAVTIKTPSPIDASLAASVETEVPADVSPVGLIEVATPGAAQQEKTTTQARAAGPLVSVEVVLDDPSRPAAVAPLPPEPRLLPFRLIVPAPRGSAPVVRGVMGYRVPLVVKQKVPDQIQDGVYIPAHETYVVLRSGYWKREGPDEGLTETEPAASAVEASGNMAKPEPKRRGWLRRLFIRKGKGTGGGSY